VNRYRDANREALGIYARLTKLEPTEPGALLRYAQAAEGADDLPLAVQLYRRFVKRFPEDPLTADARAKVKEIQKQIAGRESAVDAANPQG
jgi:regulator of sirC expression with transglutaminase-like and TPR domain